MILRAADRFHSTSDGIETWHCFSASGHYDPDNVAHGALVGVDEHVVAPGSGFDWHAHRGVDIVSWVVSGRMRHEDDSGRVRLVEPGQALLQRTGRGIRHCEANAYRRDPLRLVQMTLVSEAVEQHVDAVSAPLAVDGSRFEVWHGDGAIDVPRWFGYVTGGTWHVDGDDLGPGDSVRGAGRFDATGNGELLVWSLA